MSLTKSCLGMLHRAVRNAASSFGSACTLGVASECRLYSYSSQIACIDAVSSPSSQLRNATAHPHHQAIWNTQASAVCRHIGNSCCIGRSAVCGGKGLGHAWRSWQSHVLPLRSYSSSPQGTRQQESMTQHSQQTLGVDAAASSSHRPSLPEAQHNENTAVLIANSGDRQAPDAAAGVGSLAASQSAADEAAATAAAEEARQAAWDQEDDEDRGGSFLTSGPEGEGELELPGTFEVVGGAAASAILAVAVAGLGMVAMLWLTTWISKAAKPSERQKTADTQAPDAAPDAATAASQ